MGFFSKLKKLDPAKKLLKKAVGKDPLASKLMSKDPVGKKVLGAGSPAKKIMKTGGNLPAQAVGAGSGVARTRAAQNGGRKQPGGIAGRLMNKRPLA